MPESESTTLLCSPINETTHPDHPNGTETVFDYGYIADGQFPYGTLGNIPADSGVPAGPAWFAIVEERSSDPSGESDGFLYRQFYSAEFGDPDKVRVENWFPKEDTSMYYDFGPEISRAKNRKFFDRTSHDLVFEENYTMAAWALKSTSLGRRLEGPKAFLGKVTTSSVYNALGNPLEATTTEYQTVGPDGFGSYSLSQYRQATVKYAYWDKTKYYQQKAVLDQGGRYSYTDYYDSSAPAGKRGQTKKVYAEAFSDFWENPTVWYPPTTPADRTWRYRVEPTDWNTHAAEMDYDAKGRPVSVWKLQRTDTVPWTYVGTATTYGSDVAPWWGLPYQVIEDVGNLARSTTTSEYDAPGRARRVIDGAGKEFVTDRDLDGRILQTSIIVNGNSQPVTSYLYGSSGVEKGEVVALIDELTGVEQHFTYFTAGNGLGDYETVSQNNSPADYTIHLSYNTAGERERVTYTTPHGSTAWMYTDWTVVASTRLPQSLVKLSPTLEITSEQVHYEFDTNGNQVNVAFAQTPQAGKSTYTSLEPATTRARAYYQYDPEGRVRNVEHYWESQFNATTQQYDSQEPILGNHCDYEISGLNRGLKISSEFYRRDPNLPVWKLERTETYGYDPQRDYLTSADYGDSLQNQTQSFGYDAAGNKIHDSSQIGMSTFDNLNRIVASPSHTFQHDILGNRLSRSDGSTYAWDWLNRLTGLAGSTGSASYVYRADGMRVRKLAGDKATDVYYDGQSAIQEVDWVGSAVSSIRHFRPGLRGVESIEAFSGTTWRTLYPIYDSHGSTLATISKNASSFVLENERAFDAWGKLRRGLSSTEVPQGYVGKYGHVSDQESGLIYMGARFYEPSTGRFLNEDPARNGRNWTVYCSNDPVNRVDTDGKLDDEDKKILLKIALGFATSQILALSFVTLLLSGLLVMLSPLTWGLTLVFAVGVGYVGGVSMVDSVLEQRKWYPNMYTKENGKAGFKRGFALEIFGFLTGWYSMLEFLFKHVNEMIAGE